MFSLRPDIEDFTIESLTRIDGRNAPFYVKRTGFQPEAGFCYFYGDEKYQFFFYVDARRGERGTILDINQATAHRLAAGDVVVAPADLPNIEGNIAQFLRERDASFAERPVAPRNVPEQVLFTWKLP